MIVPGSASPLLTTTDGGVYTIAKSLRFRSSASAYLNRTPGSASNRKAWTYSAWVKLGIQAQAYTLLSAGNSGANLSTGIQFLGGTGDNSLQIYDYTSTYNFNLTTTAVYRDFASWYHIVVAIDSTQATASNRLKVYVNGVQVTSFGTTTYPALNTDYQVNNTVPHYIGRFSQSSASLFDGYIADVNLIDGQQLTASSFGEFDSLTGVWKPKAYSGTYGTNGFYLKFTDVATTSGSNAGLGKDFSGNGNYWTTNNISVTSGATYDSMKDVPTLTDTDTANYCVLNPVDLNGGFTFANGNLKITATASARTRGTIGVKSGKFYWETKVDDVSVGGQLGVLSSSGTLVGYTDLGTQTFGWGLFTTADSRSGQKQNSNTTSNYGGTVTTGDVVMCALDMDTGSIYWGKNGQWANGSGSWNQSTPNNAAFTNLSGFTVSPAYAQGGGTSISWSANFGQQPFTYTVPTGYKALNTYNLPDSTIVAGNKYMDATLYTGTLVSNAVTNAGSFKPDLVWVKSRSAATDNKLTDSVRGVTKGLISNTQGVETTDTQGLTAINSNGFTVGTDTNYNNLTATYVAWQWQAGQGSTSSNTSGSITSTVSVNASAGFSIVTYTGNNTAGATIGHGLGVKPNLIIIKNKNVGTTNWLTYSSVLGATKFLKIESTDGAGTSILPFNNTEPTSSVFSVGAWDVPNGSGNSHIAYCWTEIAGFSKFGSYTGNGSTDGTFIYLGFRPKYIIFKRTDASGNNWCILDATRNTYNVASDNLTPNNNGTGDTIYGYMDFVSNGIKLRNTDPTWNNSGSSYVYAAFAENPFKNSLAR